MMDVFHEVVTGYAGNFRYLILACIGVVLMIVGRKTRWSYGVPIGIIMVIMFNPVVVKIVCDHFMMVNRAMKLYWVIPVGMCIAYAVAAYARKWYAVVICAVVVILCGTSVLNSENFIKQQNAERVHPVLLTVCDYLDEQVEILGCMEHADEYGRIRIAVDTNLIAQIPQYAPQYIQEYRRTDVFKPEKSDFLSELNQPNPSAETLAAIARDDHCEFVLLFSPRMDTIDGELSDYGYEYIDTVCDMYIYHMEE